MGIYQFHRRFVEKLEWLDEQTVGSDPSPFFHSSVHISFYPTFTREKPQVLIGGRERRSTVAVSRDVRSMSGLTGTGKYQDDIRHQRVETWFHHRHDCFLHMEVQSISSTYIVALALYRSGSSTLASLGSI